MSNLAANSWARNIKRNLPIVAGLLILAACAGKYVPLDAEPTATIEFVKGYNKGFGFAAASLQIYSIAKQQCGKYQPVASFSYINGPRAIKAIGTGSTIYLEGYAQRFTAGYRADCQNRVAFTVRPGGRYQVVQRAIETDSCHIEIRSLDLGIEAPKLTHFDKKDCP